MMPRFELRMKTTSGELIVHFDKLEELLEGLNQIDLASIEKSVKEKIGGALVAEPRQAKPGAEFAYKFNPDGKVEVTKYPSAAPAAIGLLLFAYDPEPVEPSEVFEATGVKPVNYVSQTSYK